MTKRELDQQKLTAFALGELNAAEAAEMAKLVAKDPAAARVVAEVRAFAQFAQKDLKGEPLPGGRGTAPILEGIAVRADRRPPVYRQWAQALALSALVVLLVLAAPLRKHFAGNVATVIGPGATETARDPIDEERLTHREARPDPHALDRDFDAFEQRPRSPQAAGDCQLALPAAGPAESIRVEGSSLTAVYVLPESGLELEVQLSAAPQPLVHGEGVAEVVKEKGATLFRHPLGEQSLAYYVVPDSAALSYCTVRVGTDWLLPEAVKARLPSALDEFTKGLARNLRVKGAN